MVQIFPNSPIWADINRVPDWAPERTIYDSGAYQGSTVRARPFYKYTITAKNYNEFAQVKLHNFLNDTQEIDPFFIKDPYDYRVEAAIQPTSTNMGVGSGFYFVNSRGWDVVPDSAFIYVSDPASGELVNGVDYVLSLDNGWCNIQKAVSSIWTSSFQYFRKVVWSAPLGERSNIWNNFASTIVIQEILPNQ